MTSSRAARTPLDRLTDVEEADVYKAGRLAGRLIRRHYGVEFSYTTDYLASGGRPVATTLPLGPDPVRTGRPGAVPPFFAGLLPEGRRLSGLRQAVKTSLDDELTLVLAIGRDTIGDVQVVPAGEAPIPAEPLVSVDRSWSEVRFSDLLGAAGVVDPVGIPGVQDKASARMISVPVARAGERYLLKVDPPEYPHVVANEAFVLRAAARAGVPSASAEVVVDVDDRPGLLVRRFDRIAQPDGSTRALACEDACQVLGRWPEAKYRVSTEELVGALAGVCAASPVARRDLFRQVAFAWLSGNGDAHAKNFSVLADDEGEWRIAPAYDLVSTVVYGDTTMALPLQGRRSGWSARSLHAFAATIGLPERAASGVLDDLVERTADLADRVAEQSWGYPEHLVAAWVRELRFRHRQLARP